MFLLGCCDDVGLADWQTEHVRTKGGRVSQEGNESCLRREITHSPTDESKAAAAAVTTRHVQHALLQLFIEWGSQTRGIGSNQVQFDVSFVKFVSRHAPNEHARVGTVE